ncbi:hypothetical protein BGZ50_002999 [Haplosporangium sp. Z 11]|nr:hypothetical protein BGZ50_002999 [Haplosporangium sp. Z 11]
MESQKSAVTSSTLRKRTGNHDEKGRGASTEPGAGAPTTDGVPETATAAAATTAHPSSTGDGKVYYNGQTYEGTGRLPRDAPFTPSYVNAYTVNSAIAFVSLVVTATFFYFKIIVGLLKSPQIGPDREFPMAMGPDNKGEPRPMLAPLCPLQDQVNSRGDDDCVLFGKIVVLADSISKYGYTHATQGWLGFLADEWAGRADVVLRSFPGYNTHWVDAVFPELLHQESRVSSSASVKLVIIALGTDDASFPHTRQHVTLDAYKQNLKSIINSIRFPDEPNYSPDTHIVLVTPAPMDDLMWETSLAAVNLTMDRSNSETKEYAQACAEVGQDLNVPVVDLWSDISCQVEGTCELYESDQLQDYLMDGLHLKRMGNEVLYKGIMNKVALHFPQLHPTCWPSVFPGYTDGSHPEQLGLKRHCSSRH